MDPGDKRRDDTGYLLSESQHSRRPALHIGRNAHRDRGCRSKRTLA